MMMMMIIIAMNDAYDNICDNVSHVAERKEKHTGKTAGRSSDWRRRICVCAGEEGLSESWAVDA